MTAPKFTPGPWVAHQSTRYRGPIGHAWDIATGEATWDPRDYDRDEGTMGTWNYPDDYSRIATTSDVGSGNNAQANAHLIAAAPDLYAVVRDLLAWEQEQGGWEAPVWKRARAALGKAVGK